MHYGDIYCDIVFGANIGGFEVYCCNGVIVGRNSEQNIVGVTLKLGQNEPFLLTI